MPLIAKAALERADRKYRRAINAWALYDWANSAFATSVMAALFPPFYRSLVTSAGLSEAQATAYWAYTTSLALFLMALLGPILGALADHKGQKKRFLALFAGVGIAGTTLLVLLGNDAYILGSLLFILAHMGFSGANIFYESLLPHLATRNDIDQVSVRGYALGYLGGGILLLINALWCLKPQWFLLPGVGFALKASFLSVALWWALFSLPLLYHVPEPLEPNRTTPVNPVWAAFGRLAQTFRQITQYKQLFLFLGAFWVYNDGIGTIIKMATAYGDEIGIGLTDMVLALVLTQFVGIPCSLGFGRLARHIGTKRSILIGLGVYTLIALGGFFMQTALHFYILALMVGLVQGGTQALSRSLYAAMVPKSRAAEFFGFFSTSSKLAGMTGPLLFGLLSQMAGGSRLSILALVVFFIVGALLLLRVDEQEGIRRARETDTHWAAPGG